MKKMLKVIVRALAQVPLAGKCIHTLAAIYRGPARISHLEGLLLEVNHLVKIELPSRIERQAMTTDQLNGLLVAMADLNRRFANLEVSVPVALRNVTRERLAVLEALDEVRQASAHHSETVDNLRSNVESSAWVQKACANLSESVGYLLGRVEFVRRELMFEMRYGAGSSGGGLEDIGEILNHEKIDELRANNDLKVNVGCGHVPLDGFINVDRRKLPGVDVVAEADALPFEDGELSEVFSAHMLEHFPQEQLKRSVLPHYFEKLRSGGVIRAVVPDAEAIVEAYKVGEYSFERMREITFGGQDYDGDFHYTMMSPESLGAQLRETGFVDVVVLARGRENGGCKEFEIMAKRP